MRFYTRQHQYYCGVDLHARSLYVCILDQAGDVQVHRNLSASPEAFLQLIAPYRQDIVDNPFVRKSIEADLALIEHYDRLLKELELYILRAARQHDPNALYRLRTVPGIGKILSLVILCEIHDIRRFPTVQDFASYARLVTCAQASAVLSLRQNPNAQAWLKRTASKHGKPNALSILAHKLGRTVYYLLLRDEAFDMQRFLAA